MQEHDASERKLLAMRHGKEKAVQEANEHWSTLNSRLRSQKATSDLLASNLQQELVQLRVAHEKAAWEKPH